MKIGALLTLAAAFFGPLARQVAAAPAAPYAAYLFVYFAGEDTPTGEQIHFAISKGNSPVAFTALNRGKPILTSTVGARGIRDPTIVRTANNRFHILATDLTIHGREVNWDYEQRNGSRNLVVWDSGADLTQWSEPRLVPVAPKTAGNAWAPDAVWDAAIKQWRMYWASTIFDERDPAHTAPRTEVWDQILWATTPDFKTFGPTTVFQNAGHDVFDTTIVQDPGTKVFYRFSHNFLGLKPTPDGRYVLQERAMSLAGPWTQVAAGLGKGELGYGEGPLVFQSVTVPGRWHLWIDSTSRVGYKQYETDDIASGKWRVSEGVDMPIHARHGFVIPVTWHERNQVIAKWGRGMNG